jgi:hypothetical protein
MMHCRTASKKVYYTSRHLRVEHCPPITCADLYKSIPEIRGKKLPEYHTAMVPWTANLAEIGCQPNYGRWEEI